LVPVDTPLYRAVVSSEGGKLQEFTLKYRGDKPLVITGDLGPLGLALSPQANAEPVVLSMDIRDESSSTGPGQPRELLLTAAIEGLRVRKTLRFNVDTFAIDVGVRVENGGATPRTVSVVLPWFTRQAWHEVKEKFPGQHPTEIVYETAGHVERIESLCQPHAVTAEGPWIATGSIWYLAALIPKSPGFALSASTEAKGCEVKPEAKAHEPTGRAIVAVQASASLQPGQAWEGQVRFYVGPKEYHRLRAEGLQETLNFGGFPLPRRYGGLPMEWLGVPILLLMTWVYERVGNYGLAIILLTLVTKVLFFPLTVKSMRSMKAMQALQPQINALRSKYKKDAQALQRETMELYRRHKVNPMGGCLPMIAQAPIFYALYLALSVSVELQNATFLCFGRLFGVDLWICDLATHDPTYVLPILMGVTMFVQQKMTPAMGDPRQAKMMLMMPVIFTFMFLNLPSGLVLYWTVSNMLQIAQQYYLDRPKAAGATREAKDAGRA
jgi:YidC/Oxa1 family membrane protein insertase